MRRILVVLAGLLLVVTDGPAQYAWLYVQHPQDWRGGTGTIEHATFVLRSRGTFLQTDLYLTFSAEGIGFGSSDSVEVQMGFSMGQSVTMNDLWLWVDDQIMRALLLDKWTASSIYEDIVRRRRDPAILLKESDDYYSLRVYPMSGTGTRRVRLSWLTPFSWGTNTITTRIPFHLITSSRMMPPSVRVRYIPDSIFTAPRITGMEDLPFEVVQDSVAGTVLQVEIPAGRIEWESPALALDRNDHTPVFLARYDRADGGFYQMAFVPYSVLGTPLARRVAIVLDHDSLSTGESAASVLAQVRILLTNHFTPADSFTFVYEGRDSLHVPGERWFAGDPDGVDDAFLGFAENPLGGVSRLKETLTAGLEFVQERGEGVVLLISSSTDYCDYRLANALLRDLGPLLQAGIPVNIVDYCYTYYKYLYIDGRYFHNNDYLNRNLAQMTGGGYLSTQDYTNQSLAQMLTGMLGYLRGKQTVFEVQTDLANGFCTGRYTISSIGAGTSTWDTPIIQIGRYFGSFPFIAEFSALVDGEPVTQIFSFEETEVVGLDSGAAQAWAGEAIRELEDEPQTNQVSASIVDLSLRERVLSTYTAFLALEPNDTLAACAACRDESGPTAVNEPLDKDTTEAEVLAAYPNPFNSITTIRVRLAEGMTPEESTLRIYNTLGQLVRTFEASNLQARGVSLVRWDGTNNSGETASSGVYFVVLNTPRGTHAAKLLMMK